MTVCDYIAGYFVKKGVKYVFGFQGGAITPLIDSCVNFGINYIQNHHEQASGFAADAYSRITKELGIVMVTNGPGATNLISAIANAHFDSTPCLFITGQVNTADINLSKNIRQNGFQEVDVVSIVKSITKYAKTITDISSIKQELDNAICIAFQERKGAVLLDFPLDILLSEIEDQNNISYPIENKDELIAAAAIEKVIKKIQETKRPVALIGGGVRLSSAENELEEFAQLTGIPTVTTLMGLDVFSPTNYGFSGIFGHTHANLAIHHADLVLVLGSRLSKRQFGKNLSDYSPQATFIQVDIDAFELAHVLKESIKIQADIKHFLTTVNKKIQPSNIKTWKKRLHVWKEKYNFNIRVNPDGIDPVVAVEEISRYTPEETIVCSDVGQNQMWVAQGWRLKKNQRLLTSGGLGCMGFSLPASIGAQFADRQKMVIAFMGDGGLQMNIQELQTISEHQLPVKIIIFNNHSLGMIQEAQYKYFASRYAGTKIGYGVPDLKALALAYGISYCLIAEPEDVKKLQDVLRLKESVLIEILLQQNLTRALVRYDNADTYLKKMENL